MDAKKQQLLDAVERLSAREGKRGDRSLVERRISQIHYKHAVKDLNFEIFTSRLMSKVKE